MPRTYSAIREYSCMIEEESAESKCARRMQESDGGLFRPLGSKRAGLGVSSGLTLDEEGSGLCAS